MASAGATWWSTFPAAVGVRQIVRFDLWEEFADRDRADGDLFATSQGPRQSQTGGEFVEQVIRRPAGGPESGQADQRQIDDLIGDPHTGRRRPKGAGDDEDQEERLKTTDYLLRCGIRACIRGRLISRVVAPAAFRDMTLVGTPRGPIWHENEPRLAVPSCHGMTYWLNTQSD